jgi:hypothetical protein
LLCEYFECNRLEGGVLKAGITGKGFAKVNKALKKTNSGRKTFKSKTGYFKELRTYDTLNDGMVVKIKDDKTTEAEFVNDIRVDGFNSIMLGKSSIRNSTRPQKYVKPSYHASIKYCQNERIFDAFDINCGKCVIVKGCYNTNKHVIQRQLVPESTSQKATEYPTVENLSPFEGSVKTLFRKIKGIGVLDAMEFEDVMHTEISPSKKPGFRYEEEYGLRTKRDALSLALKLAKKRWSYASSKKTETIKRVDILPGVYTIGARNKRDYTYTDGELATSRVVHMPELHAELTSAPWCDEFTNKLKEVSRGPIYLGNSILDWFRLERDLCKSKYVLEGDWKRFDSKLYIKMITIALCILRSYFPHGSDYVDKHFLMMYDTIAIKDYHLVKGNVVRAYQGLPSGVKSTAIINSIINLLTLISLVGEEHSKDFNFIVGGDDFLVVSKNGRVSPDLLIEKMEAGCGDLGMEFKYLKKKKHGSKLVEDCPVFYKYTIFKGHPVVPTSAVLERVFMPWNSNYTSDQRMREFLVDVMPSLGKPMSHLYLFYDFLSSTFISDERVRFSQFHTWRSSMKGFSKR